MTRLQIEPFRAEHAREIVLRTRSALEVSGFRDPAAVYRVFEHAGPAFTGRVDDTVIACGGLISLWDGVADGWFLTSPLVLEYPLAFHRAVRRGLWMCIDALQLRRVQADVAEAFPAGRRWIERLGFRFEGKMPRFGPHGETYLRYALLIG